MGVFDFAPRGPELEPRSDHASCATMRTQMWAKVEGVQARPRKTSGRPRQKKPCGVHFVPGQNSVLVAEALFAHVLQRGVQAFVILVTERNKAERISAGTDLRR